MNKVYEITQQQITCAVSTDYEKVVIVIANGCEQRDITFSLYQAEKVRDTLTQIIDDKKKRNGEYRTVCGVSYRKVEHDDVDDTYSTYHDGFYGSYLGTLYVNKEHHNRWQTRGVFHFVGYGKWVVDE